MAEREAPEYPWYGLVQGGVPLSQGDFFDDCPVLVPDAEVQEGALVGGYQTYDVVVMSQSCDLHYEKLQLVLVCPVWDMEVFGANSPHYASVKGKEALRRGDAPGYHLLNRCTIQGFERDYRVVDFRNVYGVPFGFLKERANIASLRLRLRPPYREHLAQAFARFFMRVGLPVDIPPFR